MIELTVVGVVLTSLAAGGLLGLSGDVRETLSKQQNDKITEQVDINVDLIIAGATSGIRSQGTTSMPKCRHVPRRAENPASGPQEPL